MATLLIQTAARTWTSEIPEICLVGRHPACMVRVDEPTVPAFWLELRWTGGEWAWRPLSDPELTRGPGTPTSAGWRIWRPGLGERRQGIRIGGVNVRITDQSAPGLVVEWADTEGCEAVAPGVYGFREVKGRWCREDAESCRPVVIQNGSIEVIQGRPGRVWVPSRWSETDRPAVSLADHGLLLFLEADPSKISLFSNGVAIELHGEEVRLLHVYAEARAADPRDAECGFRTTQEARLAWIDLGGNPDSPPERLAWLRNRLRSMLEEAGIAGVDGIFERRRLGREWSHRLTLDPDIIRR